MIKSIIKKVMYGGLFFIYFFLGIVNIYMVIGGLYEIRRTDILNPGNIAITSIPFLALIVISTYYHLISENIRFDIPFYLLVSGVLLAATWISHLNDPVYIIFGILHILSVIGFIFLLRRSSPDEIPFS